jgi:Domain of unknown function (DUF222)/HNH endonuclease
MAIHEFPTPAPAGVVAEANAVLGSLDTALWAAKSPDELVGAVEELEALRSHVAAVEAACLAEISGRDLARGHLSWGSTGDWFTHMAGLRRGQGKRMVDNAVILVGERPATLDALTKGTISPEQAAVVVTAVDELPGSPDLRRRGEETLLAEARRFDATDLARTGRHLAHVVDPDRTERRLEAALDRDERAAHVQRFLSITDDGAGGVWIKGRGSGEDGAILKAALLPQTKPEPRRADASPDCAEETDPRDHGARLWDALVTTAQHALDTAMPPKAHGAIPRLVVTIDHDSLSAAVTGLGIATTDTGQELSPATLRRLACDAGVLPVVLGGVSEVLDVGREDRFVTPAIWRALVARDHHCTFPGCTRPPVMCHAHHIVHWIDGGKTALDNLVLLCGAHHRTVHHTPWRVRLRPDDRKPEYLPPPRRGEAPTPVRHRPRRQ